MNIILINHGDSLAKDYKVVEGRADFELNKEGNISAGLIKDYLKKTFNISRIYSSPLKRAYSTAKITGDAFSLSIEILDDLMEFNNGKIAGRSLHDDRRISVDEVPHFTSTYGQESMLDFKVRADKAISKIISENNDGDYIAVFSHSSVISQMMRSFIDLPLSSDIIFAILPGAVNQIFIFGGRKGVVSINSTNHLI